MNAQWIKLKVGMFDGSSFKRIKRAKIGGKKYRDKLTAVWFELMDLAGKCNHGGELIDERELPTSSIEDIAIMIDRDTDELESCLQYYINEGMIEVVNDIYALSNWAEYQNIEEMDKIREQNRIRQANYKQRKKLSKSNVTDNVTDNVTVTQSNAIEERRENIEYSFNHSLTHARENDEDFEGDVENSADNFQAALAERRECQRRHLQGIGKGVVMLSDDEIGVLLEEISLDEFDKYVAIIAECELSGKHFKRKTHYRAIIDMAKKDRLSRG